MGLLTDLQIIFYYLVVHFNFLIVEPSMEFLKRLINFRNFQMRFTKDKCTVIIPWELAYSRSNGTSSSTELSTLPPFIFQYPVRQWKWFWRRGADNHDWKRRKNRARKWVLFWYPGWHGWRLERGGEVTKKLPDFDTTIIYWFYIYTNISIGKVALYLYDGLLDKVLVKHSLKIFPSDPIYHRIHPLSQKNNNI